METVLNNFADLVSPTDRTPLRPEGCALVAEDGTRYPIVNGIPRFVDHGTYASAFGIQWNDFPLTQLDSHSGLRLSEERLARCMRGELPRVSGRKVLEAGCGAGRFTEVLLRYGAVVHSFDLSSAVEANASNHMGHSSLTLVQADIRRMPFKKASYDYVICLGVVQHTPVPEESISHLWEMVKPGGALVFDHYLTRWRYWFTSEPYYRAILKRLPPRYRRRATDAVTNAFFPLHWAFREWPLAQRLLRRLSPVHFYYPALQLPDRAAYEEWARLDTHDATTDWFKHHRSPRQIRELLERLGAEAVVVERGGNGVEAFCRRPLAPEGSQNLTGSMEPS